MNRVHSIDRFLERFVEWNWILESLLCEFELGSNCVRIDVWIQGIDVIVKYVFVEYLMLKDFMRLRMFEVVV